MPNVILLVEDSPEDEVLFRGVFSELPLDYTIVSVRDGGAAIAYLSAAGEYADRSKYPRAGVLFLDLRMPGLDGFAVLKWLKMQPSIRRSLFVVVLAHSDHAEDIRMAYALGADTYLSKPFQREDLGKFVHHYSVLGVLNLKLKSGQAGQNVPENPPAQPVRQLLC